jgi:hypothetical protein
VTPRVPVHEPGVVRTEAGKALIEEWFPGNGDGLDAIELGDFRAAIVAIEAEAAIAGVTEDRLAAAVAAYRGTLANWSGEPAQDLARAILARLSEDPAPGTGGPV